MILPELLERASTVAADRVAIDVVDEGRLTYAQLQRQAMALASWLRERGIGRGDRVVVLGEGGLDVVVAFHAVVRLGAVVTPVDVRLTGRELADVLDDARPALALGQGPHTDQLSTAARAATAAVETEVLPDTGALPASDEPPAAGDESDTGMMLYTSGTTGQPKGVCLSHRALIWNAITIAAAQRLRPDDAFLALTPLSHAGAGTRVFTMLVDAQRLVVASEFEPDRFPGLIREHGVTTTILVPAMMRDLLDRHPDEDFGPLRSVVYGAAASTLDVIREAVKRWSCDLYHAYGLSEATTNVAILPPEDHQPHVIGSVGRELPGVRIRVAREDGTPAGIDEVGEMQVRSDKLMSGYWDRPEDTARALADGWLRTGDLGRRDGDGRLWLSGRIKDMLIVGGNNVFAAEVEAALLAEDTVLEAAVVGRPHERMGEVPMAYVVARDPAAFDPQHLVAAASTRLAPYKVPRTIEVVESLPRTSSGKIAKHLLPDLGDRP